MRSLRLFVAACVAVSLLVLLSDSALAAQQARLEVSLTPERLGQPTAISFGFRITSSAGPSVPLTSLAVLLPGELGFATSGLGLENCVPVRLEELGPPGCPTNSRMGLGIATAQIPLGGRVISESAQVEIFSAPVIDGRLALLVYAEAMWPVSAQLVFPAKVLPAVAPYGEDVATEVPLVPTLPGGPDVAVTSFHAALGPIPGAGGFLYRESVRGRRVSYVPRGLILPSVCPRGGFPFEVEFGFADRSRTVSRISVPCPTRPRRARGRP
jgi:hypothetical protein